MDEKFEFCDKHGDDYAFEYGGVYRCAACLLDNYNKTLMELNAARRELCELIGHYVTGNGCADGVNVAIERGWDCFNKEKDQHEKPSIQ